MKRSHLILIILVASLPLGRLAYLKIRDLRFPPATASVELLVEQWQVRPTRKEGLLEGVPPHRSWMENKIEKALSDTSLHMALSKIDPRAPITPEQIATIRKAVEVTPRRGTDFIEFTARHRDRQQAILMANAVAQAFLDREKDDARKFNETVIRALDDELTYHTAKVTKAEKLRLSNPNEGLAKLHEARAALLEIQKLQRQDRLAISQATPRVGILHPAK